MEGKKHIAEKEGNNKLDECYKEQIAAMSCDLCQATKLPDSSSDSNSYSN